VGLCYDDPDVTDPARIRYDAAYVVQRPIEPGGGIEFYELPAGDYVTAVHRGPYTGLSLAYAGLYRHWLRNGSTGIADGPTLEFYLNHPGDTDAASLLTRICIPLAT
jgi:AraC family transcriptional regulator